MKNFVVYYGNLVSNMYNDIEVEEVDNEKIKENGLKNGIAVIDEDECKTLIGKEICYFIGVSEIIDEEKMFEMVMRNQIVFRDV